MDCVCAFNGMRVTGVYLFCLFCKLGSGWQSREVSEAHEKL